MGKNLESPDPKKDRMSQRRWCGKPKESHSLEKQRARMPHEHRVGLQPRIPRGCAAVLPLAAAELHKVARIARDGAGGVAFGAADVVRRVGVAAPIAVAAQIPRAQVNQ